MSENTPPEAPSESPQETPEADAQTPQADPQAGGDSQNGITPTETNGGTNGGAPPPADTGGGGLSESGSFISLEQEMRTSYLDYAMSVIVARALPDARDGLKPVQRRILHAMKEGGYDWNRPFRKSSRIVGDVMSKYHPHGDSPIYEAMVRMAQDFTMRLPLVSGQGNFGSMDDDPPAAMRYTEARLAKAASVALLEDLDRDTVDFQSNYDETAKEPTVLPARFPNLLVNGAQGIAVGMATNIPPHNLGEVLTACRALLKDPNLTTEALLEYVKGPDFPTGGILLGRQQLRSAYKTGHGGLRAWARVEVEEAGGRASKKGDKSEASEKGDTGEKEGGKAVKAGGRDRLVITEVPPGVSKGRLLERLAQAVRDKTVEGISDIRDESARGSVRVVIDLKRGAMSEVVLNTLRHHTPLQTSVGFNMLAIDDGRPRVLPLKDALARFVAFREEVVVRRTSWFLARARQRAHLVLGLVVAVSEIDEVIRIIRAAANPYEARAGLLARTWSAEGLDEVLTLIADPEQQIGADGSYRLSDAQARGILELRLQRLTGLERDKLAEELRTLRGEIEENLEILRVREKTLAIVDAEFAEVIENFATPRRTELRDEFGEQTTEDLIPREQVVVTMTHGGYIKRTPLDTYRAQRRGGKGRSGMAIYEDDFVSRAFVTDSHTPLLFFSSGGMVYRLKAWRLPEGGPNTRGKALVNLLPLKQEETISAILAMPADPATWDKTDVIFATDSGTVRRNQLADFVRINANGKIAMRLDKGVSLVGVSLAEEGDDVLLATASGRALRFPISALRVFSSRNSMGVKGIRLAASVGGGGDKQEKDSVIALTILRHSEATMEERTSYLKESRARRIAAGSNGVPTGAGDGGQVEEEEIEEDEDETEGATGAAISPLSEERYATLAEAEQFLFSLTADGYGKRVSSYNYPIKGRGGMGVRNGRALDKGGAKTVAFFAVESGDDLMLITDAGRMIRTPADSVSAVGRVTRGVRVLHIDEDGAENLVSAARITEEASVRDAENESQGESENESVSESENTESTDSTGEGDGQ